MSDRTEHAPRLFNSVFETGVRAVFVLASVYPDHGPNSLHPATNTHATEMLVRRELVHDGLLLMQGRSLVDRLANTEGIFYRAGDDALNFVSYLTSPYFQQLGEAARFLAALRTNLGRTGFNQLVEGQLERWAIQFQSASNGPA